MKCVVDGVWFIFPREGHRCIYCGEGICRRHAEEKKPSLETRRKCRQCGDWFTYPREGRFCEACESYACSSCVRRSEQQPERGWPASAPTHAD
ncbi:MAG TPA: hypothetical protein VMC43_01135 [Candidatus Paceibacterota bacterium]|nr:hypothetical protein [Candidatus Paceibacterota bacterium]